MPEPLNVDAFIEAAPWRFAKTMPHIPHEYIVRGQVPDDQFEAFVQLIREHGYKARWGRHLNTYLNVGEHKYWRIGIVINRAALTRKRTRGRESDTLQRREMTAAELGWRSRSMLHRYGASVADERAREARRGLSPGDRL